MWRNLENLAVSPLRTHSIRKRRESRACHGSDAPDGDDPNGQTVVNGRIAGSPARSKNGDLSKIPDGAILALPADFDDEFSDGTEKLEGIIDARPDMSGYPAIVARELGIPMVSGATLPDTIDDRTIVTLNAERGVIYDGDIIHEEAPR